MLLNKRKLVVLLVAVPVLGGLALLVGQFLTTHDLVRQEQRLREAIVTDPWLSFAVGFALYFVVSLVPGTSGKSIVVGWLYGFVLGVVVVDLALTAAAVVSFALSRYVFRDVVQTRFANFLARMNRALERDGPFYLLTARMLHVPYSFVNYACGASVVRPWTFLWTTSLGLLPGTIVFVYVGTQLPTLAELAEHGSHRLLDPSLWFALLAMGALPWVTRLLVRRVQKGSTKQRGNGNHVVSHSS